MTLTELQTLEAELLRLVTVRNAARDRYAEANAEFDRLALPLQRRIAKLRAELEATKPRATRATGRRPVCNPVGLTQEETDHYYQLLGAKNG